MNKFFSHLLLILLLTSTCCLPATEEKPMVIIIPSYNNQTWCEKNIRSVFMQNYTNYRVIYIDDCSTDHTYALVSKLIDEMHQWHHVTLIKNEKRAGALANLYHTIHACADYEIIVVLDGDDWLAHRNVLARINEEYADPAVWITYGQFQFWPLGKIGYNRPLSTQEILYSNDRVYCHYATHLRTFYAWLFKQIKLEDLLCKGEFYPVTWDKAMMAPMLEMAAYGHYRFISDVLYIYNVANPLSDARLYGQKQNDLAREICNKQRYAPIDKE